jgi:hypothetical protein
VTATGRSSRRPHSLQVAIDYDPARIIAADFQAILVTFVQT